MNTPPIYQARCVPDGSIVLDGSLKDAAWARAARVTAFQFPWEKRRPPATEFRALFDSHDLYFAFRAGDDDVVLAEPFRAKEDVMREDRVELFFALDERLAQYFCLEIDPLGRVLDYRASHYRKFDFSWTFPGLDVVGVRTDQGYTVEGRIALDALRSLGFPLTESGQPIRLGIYRAEFRHAEGDELSEGWMSWVDPRTEEPDFHVPTSFGRLEMVS